jgi:ABC-type phosphate transport system permease subunit
MVSYERLVGHYGLVLELLLALPIALAAAIYLSEIAKKELVIY